MSDALAYAINEACSFFYKDRVYVENDREVKLQIRFMTPTMMMGVGYLIGKDLLKYRGDYHFHLTEKGFVFYKNLLNEEDEDEEDAADE